MHANQEFKLDRLRSGGVLRVLDLFSGCGGLMLGFQRVGCVSVGGVERDEDAANSYAENFHAGDERHRKACDITQLDPHRFLADVANPGFERGVDIIIGGPPCPAYTRIGRAKLRDVAKDPKAHLNDARALLYLRYLDFVRELRPLALVMENVPEVLNFGGRNIGEEIASELDGLDYECRYSLLNAAHYGVPQMRERFLLVAVHRTSGLEQVSLPTPTHSLDLPPGYASSRHVALKLISSEPSSAPHFQPLSAAPRGSTRAVTVKQAIGDLPAFPGKSMRRGGQRLRDEVKYPGCGRLNAFAEEMRRWPGFAGRPVLVDHVTRALSERDFRLFTHMREGDDYPKAKQLAEELYTMARGVAHSEHKRVRKADYVPPYNEATFPNRWRKMESDRPARTLMAHLGKDTYSHIHYDGEQARTISVREAARLQSFPDGFRFCGSMNSAFRQIGNAVPPLLSFRLAAHLVCALQGGVRVAGAFAAPVRRKADGRSVNLTAAV